MRPSLSIAGGLALVSLRDVAVSRWANQVSAKLDENGMLVTEKVFSFLVAVMAVPLTLDGLAWLGRGHPAYPALSRLGPGWVASSVQQQLR